MIYSKKIQPFFVPSGESYLSNSDDPELIKLSIGNPPPDGFPVDRIRRVSAEILEERPNSVLNYSTAGGMDSLREAVTKFLNRRGDIVVGPDDTVTITTGGQQAISLAVQLFCDDGDTVLVENPTFMVALDTIKSEGAVPVGVKMDEDGIDLDDLEAKMAAQPKPRLLYIIPDFHNPMGVSMSEHKRREICRLAYKYDIPVLEDNPYYELRYDGDFLPFVKCYDEHGMVALTSSMSKIIAPGMRTGYVIARGQMGLGFAKLKTAVDFHSNSWAQRVCCKLMEEGMEEELTALRELYGRRGRLMVSCLEKCCHPSVRFTRPQGGMFIWVTMPEGVDVKRFAAELMDNHVMVLTGGQFFASGGQDCRSVRLSYSLASEEDIVKAIEIFGRMTYKYCE